MNTSKGKGTRWESAVAKYLNENLDDCHVERRALHGACDLGDLMGLKAHGHTGIVECKCHAEITPKKVQRWREETKTERDAAGADFGLLVVRRYNIPIGRSYAHMTMTDLTKVSLGLVPVDGFENRLDTKWVCVTLDECIALMRGDFDD